MIKKKVDLNALEFTEQLYHIKLRPTRYNEIKVPSEALQMYMLSAPAGVCTTAMLAKMNHNVLAVAAMNHKLHGKLAKLSTLPDEIKLLCAKINPQFIKHITNIDNETALKMVKHNPACLEYIKEQTEEMQLIFVRLSSKTNHYRLCHIKKPSDKVQIAMIKKSAFNIRHITNACEEAKWLAIMTYENSKSKELVWGRKRLTLESLIKRPSLEMKNAIALMS